MINSIFYGRVRHIHFIGIGGIGMSGIAEVFLGLGLEVQGSDLAEKETVQRLRKLGANIFLGHDKNNIGNAEVVVVSSDIHTENPEVLEAKKRNIPVIPRAEMLGELMRLRHGIAIAGSHGKTTTTSLVAAILQHAHFDPTVVIGGKVNQLGSNAKLGRGPFLVAEADESDGSFRLLSPSIAVITNIDPEHLNYWKGGIEEIKAAFVDFANHLPFFGLAVICLDSEHVRAVLPQLKRRIATYALDHEAEYQARDITHTGLMTEFTLVKHGQEIDRFHINLVGRHNVQNSLAALAVGDELGIPFPVMKEALLEFSGVQRRFTLIGETQGITIIDDYGHHPTEIKAVLNAAKVTFPDRRILVLFQPHRHTRTHELFDDFVGAFNDAHHVFLTDIYGAGESPIGDISSKKLAKACKDAGFKHVEYGGTLVDATEKIAAFAKPDDVIITLGAGSITQSAPKLLKMLNPAGGN